MAYFPGASAADELHYALHLRKLNEASLSEGLAPAFVIRFLWLRSFERPVVVRVDSAGPDAWQLHITVGSRGDPASVTHHSSRPLPQADMDYLRSRLTAGDFWTLPSNTEVLGMDGETCILEVRDGVRHHYLDRWCPEDGVIVEIGQHLLRLAQFDGLG